MNAIEIGACVAAYRFLIPLRTRSTLNLREHWGTRAKRNARHRAGVANCFPRLARGLLSKGRWPACVVRLTRIAPHALDDDNLCTSMKAIRDEVATQLGVDDRNKRVAFTYGQRRGGVREYAVEVMLERLEPEAI